MSRRGLSLLELVVAVSLLLLVVTLVLQLVPGSLASLRRSQGRLVAERLAQSALDVQTARAFGGFVVGTGSDLGPVHENGITYERHLDVQPAGSEDVAHLLDLRVTVRWTEGQRSRTAVRERWISRSLD